MLYQDLVMSEDRGIYTALFDNLKDSGITDLGSQYMTAQKLDARFSFENNLKECYFKTFQQAVDVLVAKYYNKWTNLINGILKSDLPSGASTITKTKSQGKNTNNVSAYDSDSLVTDSGKDSEVTTTTTTTDITGTQFIMNLYKNNTVYDIINKDIRRTLFRNIYDLEQGE